MSTCGRKALALLSSVFAVCGLGLLGVAVGTDYWLYLEEGVVVPQNQSTEARMSLHSGLWRVCFLAGKGTCNPHPPSPSPLSHMHQGRDALWTCSGHTDTGLQGASLGCPTSSAWSRGVQIPPLPIPIFSHLVH